MLDHQSEDFSALLSLYFGDRLAAVQFGVRSRGVLHGTIFGYDPTFSKYSPGMVLLARICQESGTLGINRFDLGKGGAAYKDGFASGSEFVSEGAVYTKPVGAAMYRAGPCQGLPPLDAASWTGAARVPLAAGDSCSDGLHGVIVLCAIVRGDVRPVKRKVRPQYDPLAL